LLFLLALLFLLFFLAFLFLLFLLAFLFLLFLLAFLFLLFLLAFQQFVIKSFEFQSSAAVMTGGLHLQREELARGGQAEISPWLPKPEMKSFFRL